MDEFSGQRQRFRSAMIWDTQTQMQLKSTDVVNYTDAINLSDDNTKNRDIQAMTWTFLDGIARGYKPYVDNEKVVPAQPPEEEETEEVIEKPKTFEKVKVMWRRFATDTTIHGVKQIGNTNRRKLSRLIWLVIVCIMAALLSYSVGCLLIEYYQYNTVTKSDIKIVSSWSFPSVTVCNICPLKNKEASSDSPLARLVASLSILNIPLNYTDPDIQQLLDTPMKGVFDRHSYKPSEFIMHAWYDEQLINIDERFEITETTNGRCFTFNGPKYIERNNVTMSTREGRYSGLRFYANINQDGYFVYDDITAGVRLYVTHHPQTPRINEDGIDIHPGTSTRIAVSPVTFTFLPKPYKSYGDEYCEHLPDLDVNKKLINGTYYSYQRCLDQCLVYNATVHCSCTLSGLEVPGYPPCTFKQFQLCISGFFKKFRNKLVCDCPRPCTFTDYDITVSASQMPSKASSRKLLTLLNVSSVDEIRESYVDIRVYLGNMLSKFERHEPQYTFGSILAFLGGQMGFFLGASLITVAELIETLLETGYVVFVDRVIRFGQLAPAPRNNRVQAWT